MTAGADLDGGPFDIRRDFDTVSSMLECAMESEALHSA